MFTTHLRRYAIFVLLLSVTGTTFGQDSSVADAADPATVESASPVEATTAEADPAPEYDTGDVAWMLVSIAFVLMMTCPGLALFYGGLVRKKNILSVMMQCVFLMGLMSVVWAVVGYSWALSGDSPYYGDFSAVLLDGVAAEIGGDDLSATTAESVTSSLIIVAFQGMFFIITPALICGAFAERMKFSSMAVFCVLWGLLVYCPIAHWVWADAGWLCEWNENAAFHAIDFAGGLVVHISSGVSALVCALVIGRRKGFPDSPMPPHNLTATCIGTGLLWVGWFGFNGGSGLAANGLAVNALFATHLAAAGGVVGWSLAEILKHGKASILGACSGAVAGLVCITPGAGSCTPISGMVMGLIAGLFCFFCCTTLKNSLGYDDSLDAFGVHGMGGILGAILTGVCATWTVMGSDAGVARGGIEGNWGQVTTQLISVGAALAFSAVVTLVICKVLDATMGLRVTEDDEVRGLDITQHGEEGYIFQ